MKKILAYLGGDKTLWMVVMFITLASLLLVYSAAEALAYKYHQGNSMYYVIKHGIFIITGFGIIFVVHKIPFKYFSKSSLLLYAISLGLLALTLLIGESKQGADRWLTIPVINQSFQTSDFAKIALMMLVARALSLKSYNPNSYKDFMKNLILPTALVAGLILPANLSTALLVAFSVILLVFMANVKVSYILSLIPLGLMAVLMVWAVGQAQPNTFKRISTWENRIVRWAKGEESQDRDGNYQIEQARIAIATGGLTGKGPGNSTQRNFLPQSSSDFIFSIVAEEYGLFGVMGICFLYVVLLFRCVKIAQKSESKFGSYLVLGLGFMLVLQGIINMSVNVGLIPVTGQPLPMVSMGGTSMWFTCLALGIILSVSRGSKVKVEEKEKTPRNYAVA